MRGVFGEDRAAPDSAAVLDDREVDPLVHDVGVADGATAGVVLVQGLLAGAAVDVLHPVLSDAHLVRHTHHPAKNRGKNM